MYNQNRNLDSSISVDRFKQQLNVDPSFLVAYSNSAIDLVSNVNPINTSFIGESTYGRSQYFNNSYIDYGINSVLKGCTSFTVVFYGKIVSSNNLLTLVSIYDDTQHTLYIGIDSQSRIVFGKVLNTGYSETVASIAGSVPRDTYIWIGLYFYIASSTITLDCWVHGIRTSSIAAGNPITSFNDSTTAPIIIGARKSGSNYIDPFLGNLVFASIIPNVDIGKIASIGNFYKNITRNRVNILPTFTPKNIYVSDESYNSYKSISVNKYYNIGNIVCAKVTNVSNLSYYFILLECIRPGFATVDLNKSLFSDQSAYTQYSNLIDHRRALMFDGSLVWRECTGSSWDKAHHGLVVAIRHIESGDTLYINNADIYPSPSIQTLQVRGECLTGDPEGDIGNSFFLWRASRSIVRVKVLFTNNYQISTSGGYFLRNTTQHLYFAKGRLHIYGLTLPSSSNLSNIGGDIIADTCVGNPNGNTYGARSKYYNCSISAYNGTVGTNCNVLLNSCDIATIGFTNLLGKQTFIGTWYTTDTAMLSGIYHTDIYQNYLTIYRNRYHDTLSSLPVEGIQQCSGFSSEYPITLPNSNIILKSYRTNIIPMIDNLLFTAYFSGFPYSITHLHNNFIYRFLSSTSTSKTITIEINSTATMQYYYDWNNFNCFCTIQHFEDGLMLEDNYTIQYPFSSYVDYDARRTTKQWVTYNTFNQNLYTNNPITINIIVQVYQGWNTLLLNLQPMTNSPNYDSGASYYSIYSPMVTIV